MERSRALLSFVLVFLSFGMVGRALEAERFEAGGGGSAGVPQAWAAPMSCTESQVRGSHTPGQHFPARDDAPQIL